MYFKHNTVTLSLIYYCNLLTFLSAFESKYLMILPLEITGSREKLLVSDDEQYYLNFAIY